MRPGRPSRILILAMPTPRLVRSVALAIRWSDQFSSVRCMMSLSRSAADICAGPAGRNNLACSAGLPLTSSAPRRDITPSVERPGRCGERDKRGAARIAGFLCSYFESCPVRPTSMWSGTPTAVGGLRRTTGSSCRRVHAAALSRSRCAPTPPPAGGRSCPAWRGSTPARFATTHRSRPPPGSPHVDRQAPGTDHPQSAARVHPHPRATPAEHPPSWVHVPRRGPDLGHDLGRISAAWL
jgi:hypothetical protein